jgi:hypothetical protein
MWRLMMNVANFSCCESSNRADGQAGGGWVLDAEERRRLIELLASGCSRRIAAMQIGCEASAITRTAEEDRTFAAEVIRAESNLEGKLLDSVRRAAEADRDWRAAAWLLERRNPLDYTARAAQTFTCEQVTQLFVAVLNSLRDKLPLPVRDQAVQELNALLVELDRMGADGKGAKALRNSMGPG